MPALSLGPVDLDISWSSHAASGGTLVNSYADHFHELFALSVFSPNPHSFEMVDGRHAKR